MEIRARYVLIGLFVLVVIAGAGGFVYWLWGFGGFNDTVSYEILAVYPMGQDRPVLETSGGIR